MNNTTREGVDMRLRLSWSVAMASLVLAAACGGVPQQEPTQANATELSSPVGALTQWVKFSIRDEHLEEFSAAALQSLQRSREEPGNLAMAIYIDANHRNTMFVYSVWRDQSALTIHKEQPYTQTLRELAAVALLEAPDVFLLTPLSPVD